MNVTGRVIVAQGLLGAMCVGLFFATDVFAGKSALLAFLTSMLPSAYYAWMQARTYNATRLLMHGVLKTILTVTLMAVCIALVTIEPKGFFVTFAVMQLSYLTR